MGGGTQFPELDDLWDYDNLQGTEEAFRSLLDAARSAGTAQYLAELLTQIARTQGLQRRFEEAHATLDEAERLLPNTSPRARIRYLLERGRVFNTSGNPDTAHQFFLQAWDLGREEGEDAYAVDAAHMLAIIGTPEQQVTWAERAIEYASESTDPRARRWLGALYNNLGWTYHDLGRYEDALRTFGAGLDLRRDEGQEQEARIAAWTVARTLRSLGRYEEALQMQQENLRRLEAAGAPDGYVQEEIGECLLALGRDDEARPHFARAFALLSKDPWLPQDAPERLERLRRLGADL